jgi:DNA-binding winged helix-turn-helix (wHTH) protein
MQCFSADHTLVTDLRELRRGVTPIAVGPQVFDLLAYLVQNRDRVVSKDDLFASVWGGWIVADSTLASQLPLRDEGARERFLEALRRAGLD